MNKKIALVTGASGQDGSYLSQFLIKKNYKVIAADRRSSRAGNWRHEYLKIDNKVIYEDIDLADIDSIFRLFKKYKFSEVYNLAAQSFVKASFETPVSTSNITGIGTLRILEAIRFFNKKIKFYQASTSEMIGNTKSKVQNENARFYPRSPYACAKVFAHFITKNYRESYGIFACSGILFNHESPIRGEEFVTRKITKSLSEIKVGKRNILELGNLNSKRDWGFAKDYVEAMWLMLQQKKPEDFVISTNKNYTIKDFVNETAKNLGFKIKWVNKGKYEKGINLANNKVIIKINPKFYRPSDVFNLKGNYSKALKKLKWYPKTKFKELVKIMVLEDLRRASQ